MIEEQYGKALMKLAKAGSSKEEMSCVRPAWDSVRGHTETVGLSHLQASAQLAVEVGRVTEFLDSSREKRKWAEENVRTLQSQVLRMRQCVSVCNAT